MIYARDFDDVVNVVNENGDGRRRQWKLRVKFILFLTQAFRVVLVLALKLCGQRSVLRVLAALGVGGDSFRIKKRRVEIDLDDAAVFGDAAQEIIRDVARLVCESACGGVRGDDGRGGDIERVHHGLV